MRMRIYRLGNVRGTQYTWWVLVSTSWHCVFHFVTILTIWPANCLLVGTSCLWNRRRKQEIKVVCTNHILPILSLSSRHRIDEHPLGSPLASARGRCSFPLNESSDPVASPHSVQPYGTCRKTCNVLYAHNHINTSIYFYSINYFIF